MAIDDYWFKNAVLYCLNVSTFMDVNGDGTGDFEGLSRRLDYLAAMRSDWRDYCDALLFAVALASFFPVDNLIDDIVQRLSGVAPPDVLEIIRTQIELSQALRKGQRLEAENSLLRGEGMPTIVAESSAMQNVLHDAQGSIRIEDDAKQGPVADGAVALRVSAVLKVRHPLLPKSATL